MGLQMHPQMKILVDQLQMKAAQLRDQHAAINELARPFVLEKKKIEAEAAALDQRRRANEQHFNHLGVQKQHLTQQLQQAQKALESLHATDKLYQDVAEIVRGLEL